MTSLTLEQHRQAFCEKKLMAMPISGTLVWLIIGILALFIEPQKMVLITFIGTGSIFYLALVVAKFTGENLIAKKDEIKNPFDILFFSTVVMSLMGFSLVAMLAQLDYRTVPVSVGIIAGLMWLPLSWIIQHNVGVIHTVVRTVAITLVWFLSPENTFVLVPFIIVATYIVSLWQLANRFQKLQQPTGKPINEL